MMTFWLDIVMRLYPRAWRERYEDEVCAMLEQCDLSLMDWLDLMYTALETRSDYAGRNIMKDLLNRLTGLIALLSAVGFASALFITHEDTAEFMLMISPMLSVLLVPAMHRILRLHRPKASFAVMFTGITAIGLLPIAYITNMLVGDLLITGIISTIGLILLGIWLMSVNGLAMITGTIPRMIGVIGILAGLGWIVTITTTMVTYLADMTLNWASAFGTFYNIMLMSLLFGYLLWSVSTGLYFVSGKVSRKLQVA